MKRLNSFNDFLFNLILEKAVDKDMPFILSNKLYNLIKKIDHPISTDLMKIHVYTEDKPLTLIDYDDELNKFTVSQSNKVYDFIEKEKESDKDYIKKYLSYNYNDKDLWINNRVSMKIGKVIAKLFPDKYKPNGDPGNDVESFVDEIKKERTKLLGDFKIVEGKDIIKYYNKNMYEPGIGSIMHQSCMAYSKCSDYLEFYADNPVRLLLLMGDDDKIKGRALLWNIGEMEGESVDRIFMDRIYTNQNYDIEKFKDYAIKEGWLYKYEQTYYNNVKIIDPIDNTTEERSIKTQNNIDYSQAYPFMDTLKYFNSDEQFLTNDSNEEYGYELNSVGGGYEDSYSTYIYIDGSMYDTDDLIYSDVEDRYLTDDDAIYCEGSDEWASREYAEKHWYYSKIQEIWLDDNAIYINLIEDYVDEDYAYENFVLTELNSEWCKEEDCYNSDSEGWIPKKEAVRVYFNFPKKSKDYDWKDKRNGDFITYKNRKGRKEYYDTILRNEFLTDKFIYDQENKYYTKKGV